MTRQSDPIVAISDNHAARRGDGTCSPNKTQQDWLFAGASDVEGAFQKAWDRSLKNSPGS